MNKENKPEQSGQDKNTKPERIGEDYKTAREVAKSGLSRRSFCAGAAGAALALGLGTLSLAPKNSLVRPPGGQDEDKLFAGCMRCEKCYEVCPRGVITPAHIEDGIIGMRMPVMNFDEDYCTFCAEENGGSPLCVQVCPTDALSLSQGATPQNTIIGKAEIITDWCLAYRLTGCHFCYDACPYGAIEMSETNRPHVITDLCNGCGACEAVCVSLSEGSLSGASGATSRAIVVKPL